MTDLHKDYLANVHRIIPLRDALGNQFTFMDDNARPHRTSAVQEKEVLYKQFNCYCPSLSGREKRVRARISFRFGH
ncbi:hypothetical protein YQE_04794, partial [Dendroctonus ponderosae]